MDTDAFIKDLWSAQFLKLGIYWMMKHPFTGGMYKMDDLLRCIWLLKGCESCTNHVLVPCRWACFRYVADFVQQEQTDLSVNSK